MDDTANYLGRYAWTVCVNVDDADPPTQVIAPIWRIDQACNDRFNLIYDSELYGTSLKK